MGGVKALRLLGFQRVTLAPGESRRVELQVDPRLLASFDNRVKRWRESGGRYEFSLGEYAGAEGVSAGLSLRRRVFGR